MKLCQVLNNFHKFYEIRVTLKVEIFYAPLGMRFSCMLAFGKHNYRVNVAFIIIVAALWKNYKMQQLLPVATSTFCCFSR